MCETSIFGAFLFFWMIYEFARRHKATSYRPPAPPPSNSHWRPSYRWRDEEPPYESPLGLVDRPEDEWVEWAIMEDILDGPDEGLFR